MTVAASNRVAFAQLEEAVVSAPVLHTHETGWWLGNGRASLWVMCHEEATLCRVVEHKDRATLPRRSRRTADLEVTNECAAVATKFSSQ